MTVYLDNNVLVDIEKGIVHLINSGAYPTVSYYFSEAHMDELLNGLCMHPELINIRLHTIEDICGSNFIASDVGPFVGGFEEQSPQRAFEISMQFKPLHDQIYRMANASTINRDGLLEELNIRRIEICNYKPAEIFNVLEQRLSQYWGYGIKEYLRKSGAVTGMTIFYSLFNLLDFVCYWHDKNNAARLYDSAHAYYAQFCNVLVTNDKRMRIKTQAVYSYLGVGTSVLSFDEFKSSILTDPTS